MLQIKPEYTDAKWDLRQVRKVEKKMRRKSMGEFDIKKTANVNNSFIITRYK